MRSTVVGPVFLSPYRLLAVVWTSPPESVASQPPTDSKPSTANRTSAGEGER
ncbi:hypothetical protein ACLI4Z_02035 [Natrialbaceae archaeon A-arb3/5]